MTNDPGDRPDDEDNNPFKGTPFEQIFAAFGGAGGGPGRRRRRGGGMPDLSALMSQMQAMMPPHEGAVNWNLAKDVARRTVAEEPDPTPTDRQRTRGRRRAPARRPLARLGHRLPLRASAPSAAWSRAEWVEETVDVWRRLVEPVAEHVVSAMGNALPEEAKAMAGPLMGILGQAGGAMFGTQVGQALGGLAGEVLTASDIGLPLGPDGKAALVPANVARVRRGPRRQRRGRAALPRAARGRPPAAVRARAVAARAPARRGRGLRPRHHHRRLARSRSRCAASTRRTRPRCRRPSRAACSSREKTPAQQAALTRLETTLALVEGWVDEVVGQATEDRMPSAAKLQEAVRRRRAAGGPGRVHLRRAGRARAAAAPAARRLRAVGLAALPAGPPGPRRGLGAPRPAARPPPTSTTRWASARALAEPRRSPTPSSTPPWPTCSTSEAPVRPSRPATTPDGDDPTPTA